MFPYFIDGSVRTYYLGTGLEQGRAFPIEIAQVGAALMQRSDRGRVKAECVDRRLLLLLPRGAQGVSDTVWRELETTGNRDGAFELIDSSQQDALTMPGLLDLRMRAGGKARHRMHQLEIGLISRTYGDRTTDRWLILDGAVKLDEFIRAPNMIGVAKSFRKDPRFRFRGGGLDRINITSLLAGLPYAHRTVAFSAHDDRVAFWYVRIRKQSQVEYPLMGVVKVELPRPDRSPSDAHVLDWLSGALVAEAYVTPYGMDSRWHCHLYPIYLAECAIKSSFYSRDVLMGGVRWPRQALEG